jgi:membrane fusion protein, multidrug efflux system
MIANKKRLLWVAVIVGIMAALVILKPKPGNGKSTGVTMDIVPVTVMKAGMKELRDSLTLAGTLLANNDIDIIAETQGILTAVNAQVGDYVKAGDVLFQMNDEVPKANYLASEAEYRNAKSEADRADTLSQRGLISNAQFDATRMSCQSAEARYITARKQYNDTKVKTPISGIVTSRLVDVGRLVSVGMKVANVVDIRSLKVQVDVPEADYFKMKVGDLVTVLIDLYPGVGFPGRVATKAVKADDVHTYPVEVVLHNSGEHPLNAGMFCRIYFLSKSPRAVIALPRTVLVGSVHRSQVYVVKNDLALLRPVTTGGEYGSEIEIMTGVNSGDDVVVSGQSTLADSTRVRIIR